MGRQDKSDKVTKPSFKEKETVISLEDWKNLVENLRLHQTELEMQNEELKRAQGVIEEGRQRLADLYDFAPVSYLTLTMNSGVIEEANLTAATLLGMERQRLVGEQFRQYVDPEYADEYLLHRETVARTREKAVCELRLRKRGGVLFWGRLESVPVIPVNKGGQIVSLRTTITDITVQKQADEALRESEQKYRDLVESVNSIIARLDSEGRVVFINDYGRNFFGYSQEELWGRGLAETILVHQEGDDHPGMKAVFTRMAEHPELYREREFEMMTRNGDKVWVSWTIKALRDEKDRFSGILAVGNDITKRKNLEAELLQSQKMEAIGTLAGGIAHDFNNILAAVIGFAEMVQEDLPSESPSLPKMQKVLRAASRGRDLVRQILAFSRRTKLTRIPVSISSIMIETEQFLRASLPATIDIKVSMKALQETVLAAPTEIQQIIMNLSTNASFAMRETGGTLTVTTTNISLEPDSPVLDANIEPGEYVQITISDTGSGIKQDVMKHIFEPFFTTREAGEGSGMGLAVVYGIVKSLGGTIAVESEPGAGSTFRVFIPVAMVETIVESNGLSAVPKGVGHILFVDDEQFIMEWGKAALERLGYEVTATTESADALKLFLSDPSRFDLVITDQTMPKLTGLQLARKLLNIRNNIPIILCTGYSDTASPEKVDKVGIQEFLMKPLNRKELGEAIRRVLTKAGAKS